MKRIKYLLLFIFALACAVNLTGCGKQKASAPSNITIDENNYLVWDEVFDVKNYVITFNYIDKNTVTTAETRKNRFNLNELEEGDYEITIKSITANKKMLDSDESEILHYHKYFETGCVYTLIKNDTEFAITKVGKASGTFTIEDYYRGKAVTEISEKAFRGSMNVIDITIGNNVIEIGDSAFWNCSKLERVYIPESVVKIGNNAFQSCRLLKTVNIPSSVSIIPDYCFSNCKSLTSITIPDSIKKIGKSAFIECVKLESIIIPDSVKEVGSNAFSGCSSLVSATVSSNITAINDSTFSYCTSLTTVNFSSESKIKTIGNEAFYDCESLESIGIPYGVESFGNKCFRDCTSLTTISIPDSVSSIGSNSFVHTKIMEDGDANGDDFIYADKWLIKASYDVLQDLEEITATTFKDGTIGIGEYVFNGAKSLKIATFNQSIKYIGKNAFSSSSSLWKIRIPENGVKIIGDGAFSYCALTNVSLGEGLKRIGHYAFYSNIMLDNNELNPYDWIPESVESIGKDAFLDTKMSQKASHINGGNDIVYAGNWVICTINQESLTMTDIELTFDTDRVAGIADYAFKYRGAEENAWMYSIGSVTGLSNVKYIGECAFYGNSALTSVSLNRNLTEIRYAAFYNTGIIKATLPRSLKSIGDYAFSKSNLTELDISNSNLESIGYGAFHSIETLSTVTLGESLKTISDYAFFGCVRLGEIIVPENVTYIGENAFSGCVSLTNVTLDANIETLENCTFANCEDLASISLPNSLKVIGKEAFFKCPRLKTIKFGNNVELIDEAAFYENTSLESVVFPDSLKTIKVFAFDSCSNLKCVNIPKELRRIDQNVFYGCYDLTIYSETLYMPSEWHERFNSSFRPIFYSSEFDDNNFVTSITISEDTFVNKNAIGTLNSPVYDGKVFTNWIDENSNAYSMSDIISITDTIKLNAVYANE